MKDSGANDAEINAQIKEYWSVYTCNSRNTYLENAKYKYIEITPNPPPYAGSKVTIKSDNYFYFALNHYSDILDTIAKQFNSFVMEVLAHYYGL